MKNIKNTKDVSTIKNEQINRLEQEIVKLQSSVKELALTIDKVEDEKLEVINQLKRALADYQNLEAHSSKRVGLMYMQSRKTLAEKLIPIVDDMTIAVKVKEEIKFDEKSLLWANGVVEMLSKLEKSLQEIGLQKYIPEVGSKFDPDKHEALTVIDGDIPGVIYDVIQPGYILDDIVIRPSRVVVTKNK